MNSLLASILLLISASMSICAQTTSYAPRDYSIIPPSPEVASAIKAIDIPIDYFKGIPDISLLIYTIKEGALSVPIVIQYQGGGIKVEEQEGNAGLGWTLIAGGVICRNVFGHPDEINRAGAKGLFNATENDRLLRDFARNTIADYDPGDFSYYKSHRIAQQSYSVAYEEGRSDMANDIFKVSCMGLTGTFIFNDSHNAVLSSPTPFKISPSHVIGSYPPEFVITDANGIEYFFGKQELTKYVYHYGHPENLLTDSLNYTSAWHLTKVKNIHNDSIIFKYEQTGQRERYSEHSETFYSIDNEELSAFKPSAVASRGQITYYPQKLMTIESSSVTVKMVYGAINNNQITQIKVLVNDESRATVKEYDFGYKRYYSNNTNLIVRPTPMLMSISENGKTKYSFSYYDSEFPLDFYAQDFCGYYNGEVDNAGLSPAVAVSREVEPDVVMMGSLKSIVYPTGGKTEFIWESHEYGSVREANVKEHSSTGTVTSVKTDTLVGLLEESGVRKLRIADYTIPSGVFVYLDMTKYFNFNPQILMTTEYERSHVYDDGSGYLYNYPSVTFNCKSVQSPGYDQVFFLDKNTIETRYGCEPIKLSLPAGTYDIELHYPTDVYDAKEQIEREFRYADADCGRIYLTSAYNGSSGSSGTMNKDYWGGVRISKIMSYTDEDATPVIKQYLYDSEDPATSSGVAPTLPDYKSHYYMTCPSKNTLGYKNAVITGEHSHGLYNIPVGNVGIEYSSVMECYQMIDPTSGMPQNSHRINYRYSTQQSYDKQDYNSTEFRDYQPTGSQMWTSLAHRRGNLYQKSIMNDNIDAELYRYEYNTYEKDELSEFTTNLFRVGDFNHVAYGNDYCIGKYTLIPYNKTVRKETMVTQDGYERIVEYSYFYDSYTDSIDCRLVRSKKITESIGSPKQIYYTYKTINGECIDLPETEVTVINGIIVDAKRMEYYDGSNLLKATYRLSEQGKSASGYGLGEKTASTDLLGIIATPEYSYKYNSDGNLVEISYDGEVLASYLWGYRGLYPIVEVKGLPYNILVSELSSLGYHPDYFISSTATTPSYLNGFFNNLRLALPQYDITTMTYHWILGVSVATDSRGLSSYFTYDDWGRLADIKDYNQYFIHKYDYNF